jgi:hypothetical protein
MDDRQDFDDVRRGLVAPIPDGETLADDGSMVFDRMSPKIFMLVPLGSSKCVGCAEGWVRIEAQQHAPATRGLSPWPTPTASRSLSN